LDEINEANCYIKSNKKISGRWYGISGRVLPTSIEKFNVKEVKN
tara:strand:+ start:294 stop:425 length:132 start_codon:yes stop_codon:yes gene_type:complete